MNNEEYKHVGVYDLLDEGIATDLGVSVEEYIKKIEFTSFKRAELIILAVTSEDPIKLEKAKRIFNLIRYDK